MAGGAVGHVASTVEPGTGLPTVVKFIAGTADPGVVDERGAGDGGATGVIGGVGGTGVGGGGAGVGGTGVGRSGVFVGGTVFDSDAVFVSVHVVSWRGSRA